MALVEDFEVTGEFIAPETGRGRGALDDGQRMAVHHSDTRGPLYQDPGSWNLAVRVVDSFTAEHLELGPVRPWQLSAPFGVFPSISPAQLLDQLRSAMALIGFSAIDRNDHAATSLFRIETRGRGRRPAGTLREMAPGQGTTGVE